MATDSRNRDSGCDVAADETVVILDEMSAVIHECLLVLSIAEAHTDMTLTELRRALLDAFAASDNARAAAGLLHQGAQLGENWGRKGSRPHAVFARHRAAVEVGATRVWPYLGSVVGIHVRRQLVATEFAARAGIADQRCAVCFGPCEHQGVDADNVGIDDGLDRIERRGVRGGVFDDPRRYQGQKPSNRPGYDLADDFRSVYHERMDDADAALGEWISHRVRRLATGGAIEDQFARD